MKSQCTSLFIRTGSGQIVGLLRSKDITNYKSYVNINNNVDVSVYQGDVKQKLCGTVQRTYGLEQSDQIYTQICNAKGDSVKLSKTKGNIIVCEVVVLSGTPGPRILEVQGKYENK